MPDQNNRNFLDLIDSLRDSNWWTMEILWCLDSAVTHYISYIVSMQTLNVNQIFQVKTIRKNFDFTQTWRYNTKLYDPNKRKIRPPCLEQFWLLNGMKMLWYFVFSLLFFCLELTVRKEIWMRANSITVLVIFRKYYSESYLITAMLTLKNYEPHWQKHFERRLTV